MTTQNATHFHAGHNDAGYLPESDVETFGDFDSAKAHMIAELLSAADNMASWAESHNCDDVPCPTYGDECPEQLASSATFEAETLNLETGPEWSASLSDGRSLPVSWWISTCQDCEDWCNVCTGDECTCGGEPDPAHVRCSECGEHHWTMVEGDCGTHMVCARGPECTCPAYHEHNPEPEHHSADRPTIDGRPVRTMADVKRLNTQAGFHFFDRDTLRFFNSRIGGVLYGRRWFITSERYNETTPRRYTVRAVLADGGIDTVSEFQAYHSRGQAETAVLDLMKADPTSGYLHS